MVSLKEMVVMHDLRRQGLSISATARKTGLDRKTVRKYLERGSGCRSGASTSPCSAPARTGRP